MKHKLFLLAMLLQAALFGHAQIAISTGLNAALTGAEPIGNVDPYWTIASSPYPPNTPAIVSNAYPAQWQPTPVAGTNAGWINNTGSATGVMMPGIYVFERNFNIPAGAAALSCNFSVAHTGMLLSLELINPSAVATPLTVVPTTPNYLSQPITASLPNPQAGTWKIRATVRHTIDIGGWLLSGDINASPCRNSFVQGLCNMGGSAPGIFDNPAGGFFATGLSQSNTVIAKLDASGNILWVRSFLLGTGNFQIRDLKVDPSGDLIGIAHKQNAAYGAILFRCNATATAFSWIKSNPSMAYSQLHLLNFNDFVVTGTNNGGFTHLERRKKSNGNLSTYSLVGEGGDYSSTLHNGNLYGACRRYYTAGGDFRASIFSHNANTGAFQWQNAIISRGDASISTKTRMYPVAPAIDNTNLAVLASGDLIGFNVYNNGPVELVAAQTTQTGTVNWTNQYFIPGYDRPNAVAIKNTATGYYMVACLYLPGFNYFGYTVVIKTDKNGNVQWARRLGISGRNIATGAIERNGYLYLSMASDSYNPNELILVKLDPQGNSSANCSFVQSIQVTNRMMPIVQDARNYTVNPKTFPDPYVGAVFNSLPPCANMYCETSCNTKRIIIKGHPFIATGGVVTLTAEGMTGEYLWSTGEITPSIDVYAPGEYCVTVNDGEDIADDCYTVLYSGDEEGGEGLRKTVTKQQRVATAPAAVSLSPNPTNNMVTLKLGKVPTANATVAISDQYGKRVHQSTLSAGTKQLQLQIAHLPAGAYTVTVYFADKTTATVKLVKQ
jgi:Secretion system C-terminal sorting domain